MCEPDFIDQLVGQQLSEHAGYRGTMVLMMLELWFKQRESTAL